MGIQWSDFYGTSGSFMAVRWQPKQKKGQSLLLLYVNESIIVCVYVRVCVHTLHLVLHAPG